MPYNLKRPVPKVCIAGIVLSNDDKKALRLALISKLGFDDNENPRASDVVKAVAGFEDPESLPGGLGTSNRALSRILGMRDNYAARLRKLILNPIAPCPVRAMRPDMNILRLPVGFFQFNPIELVWGVVKCAYAKNTYGYKFVQRIAFLHSIFEGVMDWERLWGRFIDHAVREMDKWMRQHGEEARRLVEAGVAAPDDELSEPPADNEGQGSDADD